MEISGITCHICNVSKLTENISDPAFVGTTHFEVGSAHKRWKPAGFL